MEGRIDKTGVMIHKVISEVDMGVPILVQEIPFQKGIDDDLQALEERIHKIEWKAIVAGTGLAIKELRAEKIPKNFISESYDESLGWNSCTTSIEAWFICPLLAALMENVVSVLLCGLYHIFPPP